MSLPRRVIPLTALEERVESEKETVIMNTPHLLPSVRRGDMCCPGSRVVHPGGPASRP